MGFADASMMFTRRALRVASVALAVVCVAVGAARASAAEQSLEETYAALCASAAAKQGETCVALRKAMLEKLSRESGLAAPAAAPAAAPVAALPAPPPTPVRRTPQERWRFFHDLPRTPRANLLGESFVEFAGPLEIVSFSWDVQDEVMST